LSIQNIFWRRKSDPQQLIPLPIKKSIMYINDHGISNFLSIMKRNGVIIFSWATALDDEGIYRVSAGVAKLKKIRQEFDSGYNIKPLTMFTTVFDRFFLDKAGRGNQFEYPPFSGYEAAGIVINYIGSLPESLFTNELIKKFNEAAGLGYFLPNLLPIVQSLTDYQRNTQKEKTKK